MKNPLLKRIPREFVGDIGKYLVIFLFMIMLISLVSAFLVADISVTSSYEEGITKYNLEDGHLAFNQELSDKMKKEIEEKGNVTLYDLSYFEELIDGTDSNVRVYVDRENVNLECVMSGEMPQKENEIALDRMFAVNNDIKIGDEISLGGRKLIVSGLIAVPDYSCLFESNADMMFDSVNFSIAVMTREGYEKFASKHGTYNYAWKYPEIIERTDNVSAKKRSDAFIDVLEDVIKADAQALVDNAVEKVLIVEDYLPRYMNKGINFTGDDMGSDKAMFIVFSYIVIVILAFVFAVTTLNTISNEAGVIGTLRASGYTRRELLIHYMTLPVAVTLIAAVIGNVLGYTWLKSYMISLYYNSYSLCAYETLWSAEAFILTTVVPVILMFLINLCVIRSKLKLSPLRFLRRDISKRGKKKAFRLNTKIPIMIRFRLRIIFQNIPNYITLFVGIFFGGVIVVFGLMFGPLLIDYGKLAVDHRLADYQYIMLEKTETDNAQAEKFAMTSLVTTDERYMEDEVTVYGIVDNSAYVKKDIPAGKVFISNGTAEKFKLSEGSMFVLKDSFNGKKYDFEVGGVYTYDAAIAVFMPIEEYRKMFGEASDYYTGYFSNEESTDLDSDDIAATITVTDLTKITDQLLVSMGSFMKLFQYFGVIMFLLLMYIMSKQIIEKNSQSISMTKILGYSNKEISGLYIISTSVVVVASLLCTIPLTNGALKLIFDQYIYTVMTGYIPFIISDSCYVKMFVMGILSYLVVVILQMIKIGRIPKADALKNVE